MGTDWKADVNALLEQAAASEDARHMDLPAVIGDYRAVERYPGWYMRKMRLRQEIQAMALYDQRQEMSGAQLVESGVTLAALLLYRMDLPQEEEAVRARLAAWQAGQASLFRPATADEVLDTFDQDDLQTRVLTPMGFGAAAEGEPGNAAGPTTPA